MRRERPQSRTDAERDRSLAEVATLAWLLDNSVPVPGTGGRRVGLDALIGLVPGIGDVVSGALGLVVLWRGARMGLPRIVVARMLVNALLDLAVGSIPVAGDAFDLWFKASSRNLALIRRHLEDPDTSTRDDWLVVLGLIMAVVGVVVVVGWLVVAVIGAVVGLLG